MCCGRKMSVELAFCCGSRLQACLLGLCFVARLSRMHLSSLLWFVCAVVKTFQVRVTETWCQYASPLIVPRQPRTDLRSGAGGLKMGAQVEPGACSSLLESGRAWFVPVGPLCFAHRVFVVVERFRCLLIAAHLCIFGLSQLATPEQTQ